MKQLWQNIRTGRAMVVDVPRPDVGPGMLGVQGSASLVSAGTERMVVDFAEKSLLQKARSRPDLVRQSLEKARRDGVLTTVEAVQNRLDQPMALGYSSAGTILEVGTEVAGLQPGDRVACAGGGYATHAEIVAVPKNLVVKLSDTVGFESAAFTTIGAIALQGIRLAEIELGGVVAVIGLGLLGQLTVQMLKAAGCIVAGTDPQPERVALALRLGADAATVSPDELQALVAARSSGHGADAVLITADTPSSQPVELAGRVARDKGRVVAVGAVGLQIPRKIYYEKELDFRVSRSYGPGRYDSSYEEQGRDYPYAYVRWTEQRNMEAFVQLLSERKVDVHALLTHRFPIDAAPQAYELITGQAGEPFLGVLLTYPGNADLSTKVTLKPGHQDEAAQAKPAPPTVAVDTVRLGVLGAGTYANATLLPALKGLPALELRAIASARGVSARSAADRFGFAYCSTDVHDILADPDINTVAILTRHHLHAEQVVAALQAGKNVFVEKPLCLSPDELRQIVSVHDSLPADREAVQQRPPALLVGYNRRFAPFVQELEEVLRSVVKEPLLLTCRVDAGYIPASHWTQDPGEGGRLLGEGCHFVDLLIYLAGSTPVRSTSRALPDHGRYSRDNLIVSLEFENGSLGTLVYAANGSRGFGKEYLEVFGGGLSARLDDYRTLEIRGGSRRLKRTARLRRDKGHRPEWQAFVAHLKGEGPPPISFADIVCSTRAVLAAQSSLETGSPVEMEEGPC